MTKLFNSVFLTLFLLIITPSFTLYAYDINGIVTDYENGKPIGNVSVLLKNTQIGTLTDNNGYFTLNNIQKEEVTLVFSCIGYSNTEISVSESNSKNLQIYLKPSVYNLSEVTISTTKNQLTLFDQTTPVSIISKEDVFQSGSQNLPEITKYQPAISLIGQGYHRASAIRGLAYKRVVVLVDGHRTSIEMNTGPPGSFVNPLNIKSVEILRGPYSTLYGPDAIGGVINIITQDYMEPLSNQYVGGVFSSNYQSASNGYNANLLLNTKIKDKVFIHFTFGKRNANSYKDANKEIVKGTNFSEKSITSKILWQISQNHSVQLNGSISLADSIGKPGFSDSLNALHPKDYYHKVGISYKWNNIASWLPQMAIEASALKHQITARIFNYRPITYGRVLNNRKNLYNHDYVFQHTFKLLPVSKLNLYIGFDFYQRDGIHIDENLRAFAYDPSNPNFFIGEMLYEGSKDTVIHNSYQRSAGLFAQFNYNVSDKLIINGGARWNTFKTLANLTIKRTFEGPPYDYSLNEHTTKTKKDKAFSGNLGLVYKPINDISITFNMGQAFRSPSTKELFVTTMTPAGSNICNADLKPEYSLNFDLGIKTKHSDKFDFSADLFFNNISDMIILEWDSLHTSGQFKNKHAYLYGCEVTFMYKPIPKLIINGNASYVVGEQENGYRLSNIPPFQANLQTKYYILSNKLSVALAGRYNAKHSKIAVGEIPTDEFVVIDATTSWRINKYLHATASVTNLFNKLYREHYQFYWMQRPGRSINAGIKVTF
ncbi:MAG: TonB-dependent receptor [Bacteroidales bacterium]|jgi:TonB-dependent heme/hemoglobin receptor